MFFWLKQHGADCSDKVWRGKQWSGSRNNAVVHYICLFWFIFCCADVALLCCGFETLVPGRFLSCQGCNEVITSVWRVQIYSFISSKQLMFILVNSRYFSAPCVCWFDACLLYSTSRQRCVTGIFGIWICVRNDWAIFLLLANTFGGDNFQKVMVKFNVNRVWIK